MNKATYISIAFLCAVFAPALLFAPFSIPAALFVFLFALGHVTILGIPTFLLLDRLKKVNFLSILISGFLIASLSEAVRSWPRQYPEVKSTSTFWDGEKMVATMIDGVPTFAGWVAYLKGIGFFGLFGLFSAFVFWLVWRRAPAQP